jgi:hypothetical protein
VKARYEPGNRGDEMVPVTMEQFRDDDRGYLRWVAAHPDGYVLNIRRTLSISDARLHSATWPTITGQPARGRTWTGPYIKVCGGSAHDLDEWALAQAGARPRRCGTCQP